MAGHLLRLGIVIPRARMRASIHRVDPINTALRRSFAVRRRRYHASGPNSVWHVDGNHKLIRWKMILHGGIDGYSRTIVYLVCTNNNRAETVLSTFQTAVRNYGLPSRVRSDLGGENVEVWRYMTQQHSSFTSVITGSSTHNERIERLWRDVTRSVSSVFRDCFQQLELEGLLDPLNDIDIFCLHWVYLPKINLCLKEFVECWNNHALSSEHNQTPNQLFVQGILTQQQFPSSNILGNNSSFATPGSRVEVPEGRFRPCDCLLGALRTAVNPFVPSHDITSGISSYTHVATIIGSHLHTGCNNCNTS